MSLVDGFPAVSGAADQFEISKDLAGLIVRDASGVPRSGVLYRSNVNVLTARTDMAVDVSAEVFVSVRNGGVIFNANDGVTAVTIASAPLANSRIDVIYYLQREPLAPSSDGASGPIFGVVTGTAGVTPSKPALTIAGAVEIGTILIPSTAVATNSSGVVITTTIPFTACTGGIVPCRNATELAAWTPGNGAKASTLNDNSEWTRVSGAWKRTWSPNGYPYAMAAGIGSNSNGSLTDIPFPSGRFTAAPIVIATPMYPSNVPISVNTGGGTPISFQAGGVNAAGTFVAATWWWMIIQMTPTSGPG